MKNYKINRHASIPKIIKGEHAFKMFGYKFFVYNSDDNKGTDGYFPYRWRVCEESTGTSISNRHYRNDAITTAKELLEGVGKRKLNKRVKEYLVINPLWDGAL